MRRDMVGFCLALAACRSAPGSVQPLTVALSVSPASLDLGAVYVQATARAAVAVRSSGTAWETVTVTVPAGPFAVTGGPTFSVPPGAAIAIPIAFAPGTPGPAAASAHLGWDEGSADVALAGEGLAWPDCSPGAPCETAAFDPDSGVCVRARAGDGTACDAGASCLQDTRCLAGQCVGVPRDCDDHDACTADGCVPGQGCVHQDQSASCTGTDPCQIYACDPARGCVSSTAPNGTPCSTHESCQTAEICVLGQCLGTPVPDGFPCALWWEPCVSDAACHGGACHSPTADAEQPGQLRWSWQPDGGPYPMSLSVTAADELGDSYLAAGPQDGQPVSGVMDLASLDACGRLRWENPSWRGVTQLLLDGQELVFIDPATNHLVALFRDSGQPLWQLDLAPALLGRSDGGAPPAIVSLADLALSPKGPLYVSGLLTFEVGADLPPRPFLAAVLADGTVAWTELLPPAEMSAFGSPLVADLAGNAYVYADFQGADGGPAVLSYDPQGQARFALPLATDSPILAVGSDRLVESQTGAVWALDGGSLGSLDDAGFAFGSSALVDGRGTVFVDTNGAGLLAFQDGNPLWTDAFGLANSSFVLGAGQLFAASVGWPCDLCDQPAYLGSLAGFDAATGNQLWSTPVEPYDYPYPNGWFQTLTLTNTANLVISLDGVVRAYFAGQQRPPPDAPWSRFRGSDANQASAAPPAQPSLPSGG
ncbi:MAG: PQQ-binding-like beta-propeller repeat protein [Myxococcales bacterium]